jgi:ABC-type antimicrobial peptide transport system permease subunit
LVIASSLSCDKSALLIITLPVVGWSMPPNKFSKVMVAIGAFILVVLASIYPAKRAGKLQISKVLNHE